MLKKNSENQISKSVKMDADLVLLIAQDLNQKISDNFISNVTILNSTDILLSFSFFRSDKLFISLDHNYPRIGLLKLEESFQTLDGNLSSNLRKELRGCRILKIEQTNDDRIIKITLSELGSDFLRHQKNLYLEFIPHRPNLIIVGENNRIRFATHYNQSATTRQIKRGALYSAPSLLDYQITKKEHDLERFYQTLKEDFSVSIKKRIAEKFAPFFTFLARREKLLLKKEEIILQELKVAHSKLIYQEYGNLLLSFPDEDISRILIENKIPFDLEKNRIANANHHFIVYKKAKRQIEFQNEELLRIKEEIKYLNHLKIQSEFADEKDMVEISSSILNDKNGKEKKRKAEQKKQKNINFINLNETKIFYGKSDKQNDELTFKIADFKHNFLHISTSPGAHIVIAKNNPTEEELLFGAELALILSKKNDGDVNYALIKDLKKGNKLGLVVLKKYQTIHINKIRSASIEEFEKQGIIIR